MAEKNTIKGATTLLTSIDQFLDNDHSNPTVFKEQGAKLQSQLKTFMEENKNLPANVQAKFTAIADQVKKVDSPDDIVRILESSRADLAQASNDLKEMLNAAGEIILDVKEFGADFKKHGKEFIDGIKAEHKEFKGDLAAATTPAGKIVAFFGEGAEAIANDFQHFGTFLKNMLSSKDSKKAEAAEVVVSSLLQQASLDAQAAYDKKATEVAQQFIETAKHEDVTELHHDTSTPQAAEL
jgi:hypothetical protein